MEITTRHCSWLCHVLNYLHFYQPCPFSVFLSSRFVQKLLNRYLTEPVAFKQFTPAGFFGKRSKIWWAPYSSGSYSPSIDLKVLQAFLPVLHSFFLSLFGFSFTFFHSPISISILVSDPIGCVAWMPLFYSPLSPWRTASQWWVLFNEKTTMHKQPPRKQAATK